MILRKHINGLLLPILLVLFFLFAAGCSQSSVPGNDEKITEQVLSGTIAEEGIYTSKEDVSLYIHTFGHLPQNFITKKEARKLGWKSGGLDDYAFGKCIGGDVYKNREGSLPQKKKRKYYECDIDTLHQKSRGGKRMIYSDDGLVYYTEDHYQNFEQLY